MKREITTNNTHCDCCNIILEHPGFCVSDLNAYPHHWVQKGDVDLCFKCAGKIFDKFYVKEVSEEALKSYAKSFKYSNGHSTYVTANELNNELDKAISNLETETSFTNNVNYKGKT
jgi:hypothetical protein